MGDCSGLRRAAGATAGSDGPRGGPAGDGLPSQCARAADGGRAGGPAADGGRAADPTADALSADGVRAANPAANGGLAADGGRRVALLPAWHEPIVVIWVPPPQ